jgi:hypothetical protein
MFSPVNRAIGVFSNFLNRTLFQVIRKSAVQKRRISNVGKAQHQHVLYAFERSDPGKDGKKFYKVGKSINVRQRCKSYHTLDPTGKLIHTVSCHDIHFSEKLLHMILTKHGYKTQKEVFLIKKTDLVNYMNAIGKLGDHLCVVGKESSRLQSSMNLIK